MKTLIAFCLGSVLLTPITPRAAPPIRNDINPAMQYYQAFLLASDLPQADTDYLFANEWRGMKLPPRVGELLVHYDNQLRLARQAGHSTVPCDWGIDTTPGPATLLPHLARARRIVQASCLRATWDLQEGQSTEAREDLANAFMLARNICRDGTLISAMVQIAAENTVYGGVAENFGALPSEVLTQLIERFDAAPARCTISSCMVTEKAFFHDWLFRSITDAQKENPNNDAKVMSTIRELLASMENTEGDQPNQATAHWEQLLKASGGTSGGVLRLLHEMEPYYSRLAVMMALPRAEYEPQARQFVTEIESSPNPLLALNFSSFGKCRVKEFTALARLGMVRAAVKYRLRGEEGLRTVPDPTGNGPFAFQRFVLDGVDRGFQLTSVYDGRGFPETLIFLEKAGPPFMIEGPHAGQPVSK